MKSAFLILFALTAQTLFSTSAFAAWNQILVCDGGKVWLDVNSDNRTQIQLVSINTEANKFLSSIGTYYNYLSGNELGWQGVQPAGVFTSEDFVGATSSTNYLGGSSASLIAGEYQTGHSTYTSFFREGNDGLKVQVTFRNITRCIDNAYNGRFGTCSKGTENVAYEYKGDWHFSGCHNP